MEETRGGWRVAAPGWQVAGSAFPTANRQPLPPYMGRVEHPCSTAADQGWSAHPSDPGTKKPRRVRGWRNELCWSDQGYNCLISERATTGASN